MSDKKRTRRYNMVKKYDEKAKKWLEVDESTLSTNTKETIRKRTESLIRLCRFNQSKPEKMAKALATVHKMYFLLNCPLEIETNAECRGLLKNTIPFNYSWEDKFVEDIVKFREYYFKTYAKK